jgi:hypothetical protein
MSAHAFVMNFGRKTESAARVSQDDGRSVGLGLGLSMIHSSSDVIVLDQPAFSRSGSALFDLGAEPLVVVYRTC